MKSCYYTKKSCRQNILMEFQFIMTLLVGINTEYKRIKISGTEGKLCNLEYIIWSFALYVPITNVFCKYTSVDIGRLLAAPVARTRTAIGEAAKVSVSVPVIVCWLTWVVVAATLNPPNTATTIVPLTTSTSTKTLLQHLFFLQARTWHLQVTVILQCNHVFNT